jgi:hypothetical protein
MILTLFLFGFFLVFCHIIHLIYLIIGYSDSTPAVITRLPGRFVGPGMFCGFRSLGTGVWEQESISAGSFNDDVFSGLDLLSFFIIYPLFQGFTLTLAGHRRLER